MKDIETFGVSNKIREISEVLEDFENKEIMKDIFVIWSLYLKIY